MSTKIIEISSSDVLDRFKLAVSATSDAQVATLLGAARTNISTWRKRNTVPYENLYWACRKSEVNYDWVITGQGEPKKPTYQVDEESPNYNINERARRISSFVYRWMDDRTEDEQAWFEIDFGNHYAEYQEWKTQQRKISRFKRL